MALPHLYTSLCPLRGPSCFARQAIGATTGNTQTAPGWYMLAATLVSMVAGGAILWVAPETNHAPMSAAGEAADAPLVRKESGATDLKVDLK
jgi:hypothetical protein